MDATIVVGLTTFAGIIVTNVLQFLYNKRKASSDLITSMLEQAMRLNKQELDTVRELNKELETKIEKLEIKIDKLNEKIIIRETEIETLKEEIRKLREEKAVLQYKISELETKVTNLETAYSILKKENL